MKCPNCCEIIEAVKIIDHDWDGANYYYEVEGTCSKCGKSYRWTEVYQHTFDGNIEEITED